MSIRRKRNRSSAATVPAPYGIMCNMVLSCPCSAPFVELDANQFLQLRTEDGVKRSQLPAKLECSPQSQQFVPKRVLEPKNCSQGSFGLPRAVGDSPPARQEEEHIGPFQGWVSCHSHCFQKRQGNASPDFTSFGFNCILFPHALTEKWGTQYRDLNLS